MDDLFVQFEGIIAGTISALLAAGVGMFAKTMYDLSKMKFRLRHMNHVFGDVENLSGSLSVVLPTFHPLSEDGFAEGEKSFLFKDFITCPNGVKTEQRKVPLYSEIIVLDDYLSFKKINSLFMLFGYESMDFKSDVQALKYWRSNLIICIGGPRSNQKLRQIMNLSCLDFFEVMDVEDQMSQWRLKINYKGQENIYAATEDIAYGYIFKISNPNNKKGKLMAVAGDSSYGTNMAGKYLAENLVRISNKYKDENFFILLKSDRDNYDSMTVEEEFVIRNDN